MHDRGRDADSNSREEPSWARRFVFLRSDIGRLSIAGNAETSLAVLCIRSRCRRHSTTRKVSASIARWVQAWGPFASCQATLPSQTEGLTGTGIAGLPLHPLPHRAVPGKGADDETQPATRAGKPVPYQQGHQGPRCACPCPRVMPVYGLLLQTLWNTTDYVVLCLQVVDMVVHKGRQELEVRFLCPHATSSIAPRSGQV